MTQIQHRHLIQSVKDALQFIAYYHPKDFIEALHEAYLREAAPAARDALAQILVNSRLCAEGQRPICQDTGAVVALVDVGVGVTWDVDGALEDWINQGVREAYLEPGNPLRASMVLDPLGQRINTRDNTPAVVHVRLVAGHQIRVRLAAKGGGSENKARFTVLNPGASLEDWVLSTVPGLGAGWCPPGILSIGVGGSAEKAMLLAKEGLFESIDMPVLRERGPQNAIEALRLRLYERINALGIGAQGLGGLTTVLDVKIQHYPTHAASLPVAMIPNCVATRHIEFTLDGSGPAELQPPAVEDWPQVTWSASPQTKRVQLSHLTREDIERWQPGDTLLISGPLLTGRDAAHRRIAELIAQGQPLPEGVDFRDRFIYYVGPVDPVGQEAVGPAGPTTSTRMDPYTELMLGRLGLMGMIGKGERGPETCAAIRRHGSVYLIAVGGAAYLVSKAIRSARLVAFADLGMEAIREFEVVDMPVTVAVDARGASIHHLGPQQWRLARP